MSEQTNSFQQSAISDLSFIMWASSAKVCFIGSIDEAVFRGHVTVSSCRCSFAFRCSQRIKKRSKLAEGNFEACHASHVKRRFIRFCTRCLRNHLKLIKFTFVRIFESGPLNHLSTSDVTFQPSSHWSPTHVVVSSRLSHNSDAANWPTRSRRSFVALRLMWPVIKV